MAGGDDRRSRWIPVETLEPLSWIAGEGITVGGTLDLDDVTDLQEMGVPAGLIGSVEAVAACPAIQPGLGRVVLTTMSHLSTNLYELTLKSGSGQTETLDVTGTHPFYDQSAGWTEVQNLHDGETLRGDSAILTVTGVVIDPGTDRVYNMDVEGDHDYFVTDLQALVHNDCTEDAKELRSNLNAAGETALPGQAAAHIVPSNRSGPLFDWMRQVLDDVGIGKNSSKNGFFTSMANHNGSHTNQFYTNLATALHDAEGDPEGVAKVLYNFKNLLNGWL